MRPTLKSIIQQAVLAASASTLLAGCSGDGGTHFTRVVPATFPDGGQPSSSPTLDECLVLCGHSVTNCAQVLSCTNQGPTGDGGVTIDCDVIPPKGLCTGRRPEGLLAATAQGPELGRYLAASAHLEAASIVAFHRLARELKAHGAPAELVARARRAAREEAGHARTMGALARATGGRVPRVRVAPMRARTLEALALENATEGCVNETYGAAVAAYQAQHAQEADVRSAMRTIAVDEAAHAQLAWDIADWAGRTLDAGARDNVRRAQREAIAALHVESSRAPMLDATLGLPPPAQARRLRAALAQQLWATAR